MTDHEWDILLGRGYVAGRTEHPEAWRRRVRTRARNSRPRIRVRTFRAGTAVAAIVLPAGEPEPSPDRLRAWQARLNDFAPELHEGQGSLL